MGTAPVRLMSWLLPHRCCASAFRPWRRVRVDDWAAVRIVPMFGLGESESLPGRGLPDPSALLETVQAHGKAATKLVIQISPVGVRLNSRSIVAQRGVQRPVRAMAGAVPGWVGCAVSRARVQTEGRHLEPPPGLAAVEGGIERPIGQIAPVVGHRHPVDAPIGTRRLHEARGWRAHAIGKPGQVGAGQTGRLCPLLADCIGPPGAH